jgi:hypothetical protein
MFARITLAGGLVAVLGTAAAVETVSLPPDPAIPATRADRAAIAHLVAAREDGPILSDAGHLVRVATGQPAVQIPPPEFRLRDYGEEDDARWARAGVVRAVMASGPPPAGTWHAVETAGRFTLFARSGVFAGLGRP